MKNIHLIYNYYPVFPIVALYTLFSSRTQVCNKKTVTLNEITGMKREINNEDECKYKEIRDVARRITEGSRQIHRLTTEGEAGRILGGDRNVQASIILGRESEDYKMFAQKERLIRYQEKLLEDWARYEQIWHDEKNFKKHNRIKGGREAVIYEDDSDKTILKAIDSKKIDNGTPFEFLDNRISLYNSIFPETKYELFGLMRDDLDVFRFIVRQRFINIEPDYEHEERIFDKIKKKLKFDQTDRMTVSFRIMKKKPISRLQLLTVRKNKMLEPSLLPAW